MEENKLTIDKLPLEIRTTIGESVDMIQVNAAQKSISLKTLIEDNVPVSVLGDKSRLSIHTLEYRN